MTRIARWDEGVAAVALLGGVGWIAAVLGGFVTLDGASARPIWILVSTLLVAANAVLAFDAIEQMAPAVVHARPPRPLVH